MSFAQLCLLGLLALRERVDEEAHAWRLEVSATAESIVVFGSETFVRRSHEHTGVMPGKSGFSAVSAARPTNDVTAINATTRLGAM